MTITETNVASHGRPHNLTTRQRDWLQRHGIRVESHAFGLGLVFTAEIDDPSFSAPVKVRLTRRMSHPAGAPWALWVGSAVAYYSDAKTGLAGMVKHLA